MTSVQAMSAVVLAAVGDMPSASNTGAMSGAIVEAP